ncbi:putative glycosyl transferase [mine drainage metagenome]|uniref:Putative glycosyl transferase n=1 Tax=mine drainage metagenome TaxID=410659 RepID=A0A1J5SFM9_9ZZZZ
MTPQDGLAVVIPFYQREAGILLRAVNSVLRQEGIAPPSLIIVDDGSPVPAEAELATLNEGSRQRISIIAQQNGGPGAARNAALAALTDDFRYVAFLDSDDEWSDDHLANALCALRAGHDAYFADHTQLGQNIGAFSRGGRIRPAEHPAIATNGQLHAYQGDMLDQIVCGNVIGTSTVVYDRLRFPELRFRPEFRNAGEDYLFWMDLARGRARFVFSEKIEARYGRGVNVYSGAIWGTEEHLLRLINELRYRKRSLQAYELSPEAVGAARAVRRALRITIVRDLLYRLKRAKLPPLPWLLDMIKTDPQLFFLALPLAAQIVLGRHP